MRDKLIGILLSLLPVIAIYKIPGIDFPMGLATMYLVVMPLVFVGVKKTSVSKKLCSSYGLFCIYAIIITLIIKGGGNDVVGFILNSLCILLLLMGGEYVKYFLKSYVYLATAFSVFLLIQYMSLIFFSNPIDGILPFLPTNIGEEATSMRVSEYMSVARISSVFTEPSHFALYTIPSLAILLWNFVEIKLRIYFLVVISIAIIFSTSGNGLILMFVVYVQYWYNRIQGRKALLIVFVGFIIAFAGYRLLKTVETVNYTLETLSEIEGEESKTYYRVNRGFLIYGDMPIDVKLIGCGYRNCENFLKGSDKTIYQKYIGREDNFEYFNSVAAILIYFGVIGFILLAIFTSMVWKESNQYGEKCILLVMFITCITSSIFNTDTWFMYIVLMAAISHGYLKKSI